MKKNRSYSQNRATFRTKPDWKAFNFNHRVKMIGTVLTFIILGGITLTVLLALAIASLK